jgi:hypothetical protein
LVNTNVAISATANDTLNGNQVISTVEATIDTAPWDAAGESTRLTASDTLFDTSVESVYALLKTENLEPGRHLVFVRGKDSEGYWGPVSAAYLDVIFPSFEINPQQVLGYASPGQILTYTLSLTNTSPLTQTYWLTGSASMWETHFTPLTATLTPKEQCVLTLTVSIPMGDALPDDQYEDWFILTVTTPTTPTISHVSYIHTRVMRYSTYTPLVIRNN